MSNALQRPKVSLLWWTMVFCIHDHLSPPSFLALILLSESQCSEMCLPPKPVSTAVRSFDVLKQPQKFHLRFARVVMPWSYCRRTSPFEVTLVQKLLSSWRLNHTFTSSENLLSAVMLCLKEAAPRRPLKFTFKAANFSWTKSSLKIEYGCFGQSFQLSSFMDSGFVASCVFGETGVGTTTGLSIGAGTTIGFEGMFFRGAVVIFNLYQYIQGQNNLHIPLDTMITHEEPSQYLSFSHHQGPQASDPSGI